jgi:4-hydroxy-tetrahydrodipicolinate synthase
VSVADAPVWPRVLAAITTPFGPDGTVDLDAFGAHVAWLDEQGLDGVFVAGTTGEGVLLDHAEVVALVERARAASGRLRVIAQVGRVSTRATVALAGGALAAGAHAVAAYVPWFYPITDAQLRAHFLAVLEAAGDAPAFMYNIPPRTVNDLAPALAGELARAGFAGMKDSTGDFERHEAYLEAVRGQPFELYTGTEPLMPRAVRAGSAGSINGLSNARPELFTALCSALERGDEHEVERLREEIATLKAQVKSEQSAPVAIKRMVRARLAERGVDYPAGARPPFA